jgi:hypothetical protein
VARRCARGAGWRQAGRPRRQEEEHVSFTHVWQTIYGF